MIIQHLLPSLVAAIRNHEYPVGLIEGDGESVCLEQPRPAQALLQFGQKNISSYQAALATGCVGGRLPSHFKRSNPSAACHSGTEGHAFYATTDSTWK